MAWITWLRRYSIRSRLLACMALVVGIGTAIGGVMSWQLWSLKGELDVFAQQEFAATQRMTTVALSLNTLRGLEKSTIINTGDSVTTAEQFKQWKGALSETIKATRALAAAAPNADIKQQASALEAKLNIYGKGLEDDFFWGPEIGLNLGPIQAKIAYDVPFDRDFDEGIISSTIGVGIPF